MPHRRPPSIVHLEMAQSIATEELSKSQPVRDQKPVAGVEHQR
jgi:hypothetical protein